VEREYEATRFAIERMLETAQHDPTQLIRDLLLKDLKAAYLQLEGTYVIRLFAEFEAALRDFWRATRPNDPPMRTRDLIDSIGARQKMSLNRINSTHGVREYRNSLVHLEASPTQMVALAHARHHLCSFLSSLPQKW
jgi:hypothetical protein